MASTLSLLKVQPAAARWLARNEPIAHPFNSKDLQSLIFLQIAPQLSNIDIQVAAVEEGIVAPEQVQDLLPVDDRIPVLIQELQQFILAVGQFPFFPTKAQDLFF